MKRRIHGRTIIKSIKFPLLLLLIMILLIQNIPLAGEFYFNRENNTAGTDYGSTAYFELVEPLENENLTSYPKSELKNTIFSNRIAGNAGSIGMLIVTGMQRIILYFYLCSIGMISVLTISRKYLMIRHDKDGEK